MYLKSIEIQGFKSFANKILFEFHNGITGIVGPNGSGKSNVADAVRWVLGEQKVKQLRGGTMQDVIFSGTEIRKPQGFAYVAITLDNSDHKLPISFDTVTVSRRLYRSGESEYRMNGSICRLKDVNELFYDTGIGKEGYSIIGQGQIDRILSGKPEERRELFDEAAGIVKFKRRKAIAQKKLEDEKQNLIRVTDILSELEKQVEPLKKQAETAKEYLQLKENQKRLDANVFLAEFSAVKDQKKELDEKETIVSGDLEEVRERIEGLKTEYHRLEEEAAEIETIISDKKEQISRLGLEKESLEGQIGILKEQIHTEQMNEQHMKNRLVSIESEVSEKENGKKQYETDREQLQTELRLLLERKRQEENGLNQLECQMRQLEQSMETKKAEMIRALNEKAGLAAKSQRYATMLEQANLRRSEVCQKLIFFKSEEALQEERLDAEKKALQELKETLVLCEDREQKFQKEYESFKELEKELNRSYHECQQNYHTTASRLESLKNLAERYEGYGNSIRRVMEVKEQTPGIHGVVADLIVTSKKYETAIETALGGSIQNIVTDSEQTAKKLIEYLKKNRYGRVTFLPLNSIRAKEMNHTEDILKEEGVLGLADSLVRVKEEYRLLASYLLGRIVVADTMDHAIALAGKYQHSLRIVTLDGELFNAGGSMTGGAFKNTGNLLGRKREMDELKENCTAILKEIEAVQKRMVENEKKLSEWKLELSRIREEKQEIILKQNTASLNVAQLEDKKQTTKDSSADLKLENRELELQLEEIRENRERLKAETDEWELFYDEKNREIEQGNRELDHLKQKREECQGQNASVQMETAAAKQKTDFVDENLQRVRVELQKLEEERKTLLKGEKESGQAVLEKEAEIVGFRQQIEEKKAQAELLETSVAGEIEKKEQLSIRQKSFFERQQELSERKGNLEKELFRLQTQQEKLTEKKEAQVNYMWQEYELTYSRAEDLYEPSWSSVHEMKKQLEYLKNKIRELGHVNVNAIEDYKEVSGRYEFMKTQHEDLMAAETALLKIIDELDAGMRRQFEEKFKEIGQEFDRVFRELFGGGHGKLSLEEDTDILEAGIQIISQPPGKKLQNMMQLSGGEKALTAISLLFAIQNLKPSPFCLLDEIEAALDDSNVDRFAKYLNKLTKNTQFIVITHRRGTMMASDRLYGITMQEKGVSTLVSVNLIEDELEQDAGNKDKGGI